LFLFLRNPARSAVRVRKECVDKILSFISENSGEIALTYTRRSMSVAQSHARSAQAEESARFLYPNGAVEGPLLQGVHRAGIVGYPEVIAKTCKVCA
jgi:hypothetical protein